MHCKRCEVDYFGGGVCARCGAALERGDVRFSRTGQPLFRGETPPMGEPVPPLRTAREEKEPGGADGFFIRLGHKLIESVFASALFSVILRIGTFLFKVADSLMATGGDIRPGISLLPEMKKAISECDVFFWVLITILVFRFRHNPR